VEMAAVTSDSSSASREAGEVNRAGSRAKSTRSSKPATGSTISASPTTAGTHSSRGERRPLRSVESRVTEHPLPFVAQNELHELSRQLVFGGLQQHRDRVRVRCRVPPGDRYPVDLVVGGAHIRDVHQSGVRLSRSDLAEHRLHVRLLTRRLELHLDRKSTRLNSSHVKISYAV